MNLPDVSASLRSLASWPARRWIAALVAGIGFALVVAIPTDLIDTPFFGREVPPTWWAWPSLVVSSTLAGLLVATYVASGDVGDTDGDDATHDAASRGGWIGAVLTFFAVGCPVCNKLVLVALGSAGAMTWFEPVQPVIQFAAIALLLWALYRRLQGENHCPTRPLIHTTDGENRG